MEWARTYYESQSRTFASGVITDSHRAIAKRLHGLLLDIPDCRRVLELGAGVGGTAAALAEFGYEVHAVEFNAADAALARRNAMAISTGWLTIIEQDFYTVSLDDHFDFIDGFGIGSDDDQRRLLRRIGTEWLAPSGRAVIDDFSPWNWKRREGETSVFTSRDGVRWERRISFDDARSRFIDHWEPLPGREEHRTQSIRCYTPTEFEEIAVGSGLHVVSILGMDGRRIDVSRLDQDSNRYLKVTNGFLALLSRDDPSPARSEVRRRGHRFT